MRLKILLFLLLLGVISTNTVKAQGKLMLVGGGSETDGGWSDKPYTWFVENAVNKKIAIISYSDADQWLPDYFKKLGAEEARNIKIASRDAATSDTILNHLIGYDALFFKGGDQSRYYEFYKNTPVQQAIQEVYEQGGVIGGTSAGMAILSGIMFTAEIGSAYPIDALQDINSEYITLANDFLNFYPNYIFDTHFIERGRTPRLIGFMANWYVASNELINGIGIDDRTAFCIDNEGLGSVFGTGAASIYLPKQFKLASNQLIDSDVKAIQLTHMQSFDLINNRRSVIPLSEVSEPELPQTYYNVFASGKLSLNDNKALLNEALTTAQDQEEVIIITDNLGGVAIQYHDYLLEEFGLKATMIETSQNYNLPDSTLLRNKIRLSSLLLFIDANDLPSFLENGPTGVLLQTHMKRNKITSVFLGNITNKLGHSFCTNIYSDPFNAYYDDLAYSKGLDILPHAFIQTNAFTLDQKDYYENVSSALIDQLLNESLAYGVYLTGDAYLKYVVDENDHLVLSTHGSLSSVLVFNKGTAYERTNQSVRGNTSRTQFAFDSLSYKISNGSLYSLGLVSEADQTDYTFEEAPILGSSMHITHAPIVKQNPVYDKLFFNQAFQGDFDLSIFNQQGKIVLEKQLDMINPSIDVSMLKNGFYILKLQSHSKNKVFLNKIIKR